MREEQESYGRIEVAPEVLATIAQLTTLRVEGVSKMAPIPVDRERVFHRATRQNGVVLNLADNRLKFDIYVIMEPHVNILEASRKIQTAVAEAMDTMVGVPVESINVHVEDVIYQQGEVV